MSGGHSVNCLKDDTLCLDLKFLNGVEVDPSKETVTAQGGCYLEDLDLALKEHKLATPLGTFPKTGMGLLLIGGWGWLSSKFGRSVDNILSMDIVLSSGKLVTCTSGNEYSDLFWAQCGGNGNFGLVTSVTLKCFPMDTVMTGEMAFLCLTKKQKRATFGKIVTHLTEAVKETNDLS